MDNSDRWSAGRIAAFSLPVILFQAIELAWRAWLPQHLTATIGLSLASVGLLMVAIRCMDAIADPIMGWVSDHVDTRYGRRRPWMLLGVPLVSAGAVCLFCAGSGASVMAVLLASVALHLGYSLIVTPHGGWGLEISRDVHERTRLMSAKIWFASAGSIGILLIIALLERGFSVNRAGVATMLGILIALLAPLTVLPVTSLFREREQVKAAPAVPLFATIRAIFGNPLLHKPLALYLLLGVADASSAACFLFFTDNVLQLRGWGATMMVIQPVVVLITLPLWTKASQHHGRERILMLSYGWQLFTTPLALLLPANNLAAATAFLSVRNLSWGVDYALLRSMVADAVDRDIAQGTNRAGLYYALSSIVLKIAMGLGAACAVWLIASSHFDAKSPILSQEAATMIRIAYSVPSCAAALAALLILRRRPLLRRGTNRDFGRPYPDSFT
ncbi:MFS transporter [Sphingobium sp. EM0848]|uniref:MFS transporter n=1 Tax=Sphingobium sp. EM0848 TaxID=2743473 RepID=UPI00159C9B09|nr:MFS transporter [Sphingobium sp. EM0848]